MPAMDLKMNFRTNSAEFINELRRAGDGVEQISKTMERAFERVNVALETIGIGFTGYEIFKKLIEESEQAETAANKIATVLRSTGGVAGVTAEQVDKVAESLSRLTGIDDDVIKNGQALLLTFKGIGKDIFPQATQAMLDMSEAMGQDLKSSAIQLGKALNDPKEGLSALQRIGVTFTESQKQMITQMEETGDIAGAQKIILQELQSEFGNMSIAARDTLGGAFKALETAVANFFEKLGTSTGAMGGFRSGVEFITAAIEKLTDNLPAIIKQMDEIASNLITLNNLQDESANKTKHHEGVLNQIGNTLGSFLKPAINAVIGAWLWMGESLREVGEDWAFVGKAIANTGKVIGDSTKAIVNTGQFMIDKYIKPITQAMGLATDAFGKFESKLFDWTFKVKDGLKGSADAKDFFGKDYLAGMDKMQKEVEEKQKKLHETASKAPAFVKAPEPGGSSEAHEKDAKTLKDMLASLSAQVEKTKALNNLDSDRALHIEAQEKASKLANLGVMERYKAEQDIYALLKQQKTLEDEKAAKKAHDQDEKSLKDMLSSLSGQVEKTRQLNNLDADRALHLEAEERVQKLVHLGVMERYKAEQDVYNLLKQQKALESEKVNDAKVQSLHEQTEAIKAQALGLTDEYELTKKIRDINADPYLSPEKKQQYVAATLREVAAQKESKDLMEEQKKILKEASDGTKDYSDRVDLVNAAMQKGALTIDQYREAMQKLNDERQKDITMQDDKLVKMAEETEKMQYQADGLSKEYDLLKKIRDINADKYLSAEQKAGYIKAIQDETAAQEKLTDRMDKQKEIQSKLSDSTLSYKDKLDMLIDAQQKGILNSQQYGEALQKLNDNQIKNVTNSVKNFAETTLNGFANAIANGQKLNDVFKNMLKQLALLAAQKLLIDPLSNALGNLAGRLYGGTVAGGSSGTASGGTSAGGSSGGLLSGIFGGLQGKGGFLGNLGNLFGGGGTSAGGPISAPGSAAAALAELQKAMDPNELQGMLSDMKNGTYQPTRMKGNSQFEQDYNSRMQHWEDLARQVLAGQGANAIGGANNPLPAGSSWEKWFADNFGIKPGQNGYPGGGAAGLANAPSWIWQFAEMAPGGWAIRTAGGGVSSPLGGGARNLAKNAAGQAGMLGGMAGGGIDPATAAAFQLAKSLIGQSSAGPAWKVIMPDCPCPTAGAQPAMMSGSSGAADLGALPGFAPGTVLGGPNTRDPGAPVGGAPDPGAMRAMQEASAARQVAMLNSGSQNSGNQYLSSQQTQMYLKGLANQSATQMNQYYQNGIASYGQVQNLQGAWSNALATQAAMGYSATPNWLKGLNGGSFEFAGGTGIIGTQVNEIPEEFVTSPTRSSKPNYTVYNGGDFSTQLGGSLLYGGGGLYGSDPAALPYEGGIYGQTTSGGLGGLYSNRAQASSDGVIPFTGLQDANPLNSTAARWGMNTSPQLGPVDPNEYSFVPSGRAPIFGRARGGPMTAGDPYLVGEEGSELVIPQAPSNVIPHPKLMEMLAGGNGKVVVNNNNRHVPDMNDGHVVRDGNGNTHVNIPDVETLVANAMNSPKVQRAMNRNYGSKARGAKVSG